MGSQPAVGDRLVVVVGGQLPLGGEHHEEARVVAARGTDRRDPVRHVLRPRAGRGARPRPPGRRPKDASPAFSARRCAASRVRRRSACVKCTCAPCSSHATRAPPPRRARAARRRRRRVPPGRRRGVATRPRRRAQRPALRPRRRRRRRRPGNTYDAAHELAADVATQHKNLVTSGSVAQRQNRGRRAGMEDFGHECNLSSRSRRGSPTRRPLSLWVERQKEYRGPVLGIKEASGPRTRAPAHGGRPAGLFTWLAVGLVVVVVAALVIIKIASGGPSSTGSTTFHARQRSRPAELTTVPASVFNTVGVTSPIAR